ncbi:hypothetical protein [Botrimarina mediterranea]|uniref:hypothetical protein n=1 Tax=Botrimarina mediterranea TaxID=2528022 RepID=UPI00119F243E|nr:hypothetical protein [Botrimarina mediterranea]
MSTYREWEVNGLINSEAVQNYDNGRFAGSWTKMPDELAAHAFQYVGPAAHLVSLGFYLNAIYLGLALWSQRDRADCPEGVTDDSPGQRPGCST